MAASTRRPSSISGDALPAHVRTRSCADAGAARSCNVCRLARDARQSTARDHAWSRPAAGPCGGGMSSSALLRSSRAYCSMSSMAPTTHRCAASPASAARAPRSKSARPPASRPLGHASTMKLCVANCLIAAASRATRALSTSAARRTVVACCDHCASTFRCLGPQRVARCLLSRDRRPALPVQRQQPAQDLVVGHRRRVVGPAVGGGHRGVERVVRLRQPGRALVVEVGQRALGELLLEAGLGRRCGRGTASGPCPAARPRARARSTRAG